MTKTDKGDSTGIGKFIRKECQRGGTPFSELNNLLYFTQKSIIHIYHYDVASKSEMTPCIKTYKPLVVYRFSGNVMK